MSGVLSQNVLATARLLEASRVGKPSRFVLASSSSVYGNADRFPTDEDQALRPRNPYAVSKVASEQLCTVFASTFGVPTVALRYFTVYGPRLRPHMAFHRLFEASLDGHPFLVHGDGSASRQFTFVGDVVRATISAAMADVAPGTVLNIAGGETQTMTEVVVIASELAGEPVLLEHGPNQQGDVDRTNGCTSRARSFLGWSPQVSLREGMALQLAWHRAKRR